MDNATTTPAELPDEQIRERFERSVRNSKELSGNTPLGAMTVNGQFAYYMDANTDTLWIGYRAGFRAALRT